MGRRPRPAGRRRHRLDRLRGRPLPHWIRTDGLRRRPRAHRHAQRRHGRLTRMGMLARAFNFSLRPRNLNNPDVPFYSAVMDYLADWGGGTADSGISVTGKSALRLAAVYRCVQVLADGV